MRFSEKSFEVRFCAALSAAIMPFDRNPQWFGMTQAEERAAGIDAMLRVGGRLLLFQFKAKQKRRQVFYLEKWQWRNLNRIAGRFPNSAYYIFSELEDTQAAAKIECIIKHSWCCAVSKLGTGFEPHADSATLTLDPVRNSLVKSRPMKEVSVQRVCQVFGCFCPPALRVEYPPSEAGGVLRVDLSTYGIEKTDLDQPILPLDSRLYGIPLGDVAHDGHPLGSAEEFEQLLGEGARSNLPPGLFGLFLPQA